MRVVFYGWHWASLAFLAYTLACGVLLPGLRRPARVRSAVGCVAGAGLTLLSGLAAPAAALFQWLIFPGLVLLIGYWSSGFLFRQPSARVEAALAAVDAALRVRATARAVPRAFAELLEFAYAAVYILIPMALAIHLWTTGDRADPPRFWTVILVTDFLCFALLPWIQSRPPRALEAGDPWRSSFRAFNLQVVGGASIRVNTCPSGHAAEALAAALVVTQAPPAVVVGMGFSALTVTAGAVYGRYHYAVDALAGWAIAVVVWAVVWR